MDSIPILSLLTFLPLAGALLLLFIDKSNKGLIRGVAFTTTVIVFMMSVPLYFYFENTHEMQFVEKREWIPDWGVYYSLGIDGISLFLILLTTLTTAICVASTWTAIDKHVKEFIKAVANPSQRAQESSPEDDMIVGATTARPLTRVEIR